MTTNTKGLTNRSDCLDIIAFNFSLLSLSVDGQQAYLAAPRSWPCAESSPD